MSDENAARATGIARSELAIALGALALSAIILWQALEIPVSPMYARVGPTVVPLITAAGMALLGLLLLIAALRGGWQTAEERESTPDRGALLWLASGLVANVLLIGPAGFTVASVALFTLAARAFGSRRTLRDATIGLAFALIAYFGFARALGINIGAGPFERALEALLGTG